MEINIERIVWSSSGIATGLSSFCPYSFLLFFSRCYPLSGVMLWWILISQQLTLKDKRGGEVDEYSSGRTDGVWCRTAQVAGPPRLLLCIESVWLGVLSPPTLWPPCRRADDDREAPKWFLDVPSRIIIIKKGNKKVETIEGKAVGARATNHQMTNRRRRRTRQKKQTIIAIYRRLSSAYRV
jgi:hypothetical protein